MAHAHDIDARDALANVRVDAFEVAENGLLPIVPIFIEEKLAVLHGNAFGESPIKGPDGAADVGAQTLVSGIDVAKRGRVEKDCIPGGLRTAGVGNALECEVGSEPRGINEIAEGWKTLDEIRGKECRRGEDEKFSLKFGVACEDADA